MRVCVQVGNGNCAIDDNNKRLVSSVSQTFLCSLRSTMREMNCFLVYRYYLSQSNADIKCWKLRCFGLVRMKVKGKEYSLSREDGSLGWIRRTIKIIK